MSGTVTMLLEGDLIEEEVELELSDLCRACQVPPEQVFELVEEGVIVPTGMEPDRWRFAGASVRRARVAMHLQRDLGVNPAGAALALDLLDELESLRARREG
jgi:chaperone modulatory protein CbpM